MMISIKCPLALVALEYQNRFESKSNFSSLSKASFFHPFGLKKEDSSLGQLTSLGLGYSCCIISGRLGLVRRGCSFSSLDFSCTRDHFMVSIIENRNLSSIHNSLVADQANCIISDQLDLVLLDLYMANLVLDSTGYQMKLQT